MKKIVPATDIPLIRLTALYTTHVPSYNFESLIKCIPNYFPSTGIRKERLILALENFDFALLFRAIPPIIAREATVGQMSPQHDTSSPPPHDLDFTIISMVALQPVPGGIARVRFYLDKTCFMPSIHSRCESP